MYTEGAGPACKCTGQCTGWGGRYWGCKISISPIRQNFLRRVFIRQTCLRRIFLELCPGSIIRRNCREVTFSKAFRASHAVLKSFIFTIASNTYLLVIAAVKCTGQEIDDIRTKHCRSLRCIHGCFEIDCHFTRSRS